MTKNSTELKEVTVTVTLDDVVKHIVNKIKFVEKILYTDSLSRTEVVYYEIKRNELRQHLRLLEQYETEIELNKRS